ncbi:KilA-N domain-containing protein [Citrobacter braakii]|uniref:KilA-N domain-containing protein n=1 Tax=Citrobacter braakii TaxID=57706 RepID=UPI002B24F762|nr:KilA-N domain-containing protein [Citrobacter braakii]MEB2439582.1 KilA-N domain-containing protein [Citrobacter braakii]
MSQLLVIDGVSVRRDMDGRFCLNDLHRASGGEKRHQPSNWASLSQTQELIAEISSAPDITGAAPIITVAGGNNQGTFVCKELVYSYAMWISPKFNLKVIRTFDAAHTPSSNAPTSDKIQAGIILLESAAKMLNLSNSSKLGAYQKLQQVAGLPDLMPHYAIDAPTGAMDGSSRPTQSLSALLKLHGIRMTATQAYQQLAKLGVVEHKERRSRSGANGVKRFWSMTAKGCMFGKNITSPANPRETQPHFFESKFPDLLKLLNTVHHGGYGL